MNNTGRNHLEALSKSKNHMAEGQPNLENWKIVDHTGQKIGTVYDLLFDKEEKKVRYIIANLKNGELLEQDRLVLMPVGRARYREAEHQVVFPNVTREQLSSLPDFLTVERLTQEDEYAVRNAYSGEGEGVSSSGDQDRQSFYDHEDFNEDNFYNRKNTREGAKVETNRTDDRRIKEDRNEPSSTSGKVKAGGGSDPLLSGTGDQKTSSENHKKKNEDVNVHPNPAERSDDRLGSINTKETNGADTERRSKGRIKGDSDRK